MARGRMMTRHRKDTARNTANCTQMLPTKKDVSRAHREPTANHRETSPTVAASNARRATRAASQQMLGMGMGTPPFEILLLS